MSTNGALDLRSPMTAQRAGQATMVEQTNTRPRSMFIVPHVRTGTGARLTDPRDVYENNTNTGNRRMREMILNLMPPWFIEEAKDLCYKTLADDKTDGATLTERAATAVARFGRIGVRPEQLAQRLGAPQAAWSANDLGRLAVIFTSIERGETTKEDEFGAATSGLITAADLAVPKPSPAGTENPSSMPPAAPGTGAPPAGEAPARPPQRASTGQVGMIRKAFERLTGVKADDETPNQRKERLRLTSRLARVPYPGIGSTTELLAGQARDVREMLARCETIADVEALVDSGALADDPRGEDGQEGGGGGE